MEGFSLEKGKGKNDALGRSLGNMVGVLPCIKIGDGKVVACLVRQEDNEFNFGYVSFKSK